jgi:pimeloyl-ACP methyl ester carboxylesterase
MGTSIDLEPVRVGVHHLPGELQSPTDPLALVVFAHGSGSSRTSPRNRFVAAVLHRHRLATLLFDLLTEDEAADRRHVFDIALLSRRMVQAIDWLAGCDPAGSVGALGQRPVGLFGASTGAAAALCAAAECPDRVFAVVSRGGRGDLAASHLERVRAPTLLIVGGEDYDVLDLNRDVLRAIRCEKRLEVVPGATHLFEEPGTLDIVAEVAGDWFVRHARARSDS